MQKLYPRPIPVDEDIDISGCQIPAHLVLDQSAQREKALAHVRRLAEQVETHAVVKAEHTRWRRGLSLSVRMRSFHPEYASGCLRGSATQRSGCWLRRLAESAASYDGSWIPAAAMMMSSDA